MDTLRVLHVVSSMDRGGIETSLLQLLRAIPRDAVAMDVCCKGSQVGALAPSARDLGATVYHCPLRPALVGFVRRLGRIVKDNRYDVVHVHLNALSGPAVWAARSAGAPVMTTFHNVSLRRRKWYFGVPGPPQLWRAFAKRSIRYAARHSDLVTGVSQSTLALVSGMAGLALDDARVVHLGVPTPAPLDPGDIDALRAALAGSRDVPMVLHVGRFCGAKNHVGVLAVFARVLQRLPHARLLLVGDGPLRSEVEREAVRRGIDGSTRFLGWRDDVSSLMQCSDVMLFPSLYEGLPVAVLEAGAAGLPVVASDIPCIGEIIEHGKNGYLHDREDIEGMAGSTVRILSDRDHAARLAEAARRRHATAFSLEQSVEHVSRLYREVAASAAQASMQYQSAG